MKNISFSLTTPQFKARTKTVTRRLNWLNVRPGDILQGVEKAMELKAGEHPVKLGPIRVVSVRRESLHAIYGHPSECVKEGFPNLTPIEFVAMFCKHMKCSPDTKVTRIEFEYL